MQKTSFELISAIKENNEKALEALYLRNFKKVEQFVINNSGNAEDAKDLYQEAFISLWRNIQANKFEPQNETSIDGYLYRIAQYKWIDQLRLSAHKQQKLNVNEAADFTISQPEWTTDDEFETKVTDLKNSFLQLGQNCKKLLTDFYYEKKSLKIIAEASGWTEATAKNNKYRCLQKLRDIVKNKKT